MQDYVKGMVSVIIPSYNRKDTIQKSIQSVLAQTYQNIEVIVIDDGSDDGTNILFSELCDSRVSFYRYEDNKGACYARNLGCEYAKGEYIAFQDSDDIWHDDKIQKQINCLLNNNADFVFCGMKRINPAENNEFYYPVKGLNNNKDIFKQLLKENPISTQTILLKREIIKKVMFDITFKRYQDWDFSLQVAKAGFTIYYMEEALVDSIIQINSISSTVKNYMGYKHLYEKYLSDYKANKEAHAAILTKLGVSLKEYDKNESRLYIRKSLKYKFIPKNFLRLIASYCGIW